MPPRTRSQSTAASITEVDPSEFPLDLSTTGSQGNIWQDLPSHAPIYPPTSPPVPITFEQEVLELGLPLLLYDPLVRYIYYLY